MIGSIAQTTKLLKEYNLQAKKKYGQNFLISSAIIEKVGELIDKQTTVIEIGAGLGAITEILCLKAKQVFSYEIDKQLYNVLLEILPYDNLKLFNDDFLKTDLVQLLNEIEGRIVFVSNLPYYITTQILTKIFLNSEKIDLVIVMMQKEVADRFLKEKADKEYNSLQVLVEYCADVEILSKVNKNNFIPVPGVDSTILKFKIKENLNNDYIIDFYDFLNKCFLHRRKYVLSNLVNSGIKLNKDEFCDLQNKRVEQMKLTDYIRIYEGTK